MNKSTAKRPVAKRNPNPTEIPVVSLANAEEWSAWLASRHRSSRGVWLKIARKAVCEWRCKALTREMCKERF